MATETRNSSAAEKDTEAVTRAAAAEARQTKQVAGVQAKQTKDAARVTASVSFSAAEEFRVSVAMCGLSLGNILGRNACTLAAVQLTASTAPEGHESGRGARFRVRGRAP